MQVEAEEYICENCGFTSPVPNDSCPECGGKMSSLDGKQAQTDDSDEYADQNAADGTESLEDLREQEELDEAQSQPYDDEDA